ncbi:hypothetical protein ABG943_01740 [Bifidobacterium catenulatum]|uniref:hypothetical protein n=1 Tax=Bifidobacterium catenulatum TaxID=1686 RepID=UPI00325AF64C
MTDKRWKILLAVNAGLALLLVGFAVGIVAASSSSTVYSTDPAQCPTDATFCESVNVWRRSDAADIQPNAPKSNRSSALIDA